MSELAKRVISAIVMMAYAAFALWAGGWVFSALITFVAAIAIIEWRGLVWRIANGSSARLVGLSIGIGYVGLATLLLVYWRQFGVVTILFALGVTIATDVGAYFAGRTFGGPKIAPWISPSKTWSGLCGGMLAAGLVAATSMSGWLSFEFSPRAVPLGALLALVAQSGDFLESGLKRRARVKDSGRLIPGHGGVLDRIDGLIAVVIAIGGLNLVLNRAVA